MPLVEGGAGGVDVSRYDCDESLMAMAMVRTGGLEPPLPCGKQIFVPLRLSPPAGRSRPGVRGLDYPFAIAARRSVRGATGAARLVSTPSLDRDAGGRPRLFRGLGSGLAWVIPRYRVAVSVPRV